MHCGGFINLTLLHIFGYEQVLTTKFYYQPEIGKCHFGQNIFFSLLLCQAVLVTSSNDEGRLVKNLLENYSRVGGRWARGVTSNKDVLNVTHGLTINNVHIDLAQGVMTVTAWENLVRHLTRRALHY